VSYPLKSVIKIQIAFDSNSILKKLSGRATVHRI